MDQGGATTTSAATAAPAGASSDYHNEFFNTGRVGRRNAMPDILGRHCTTSTADLPDQLGALSTKDNDAAATAAAATAEPSAADAAAASSSSSSS